MVAAQALACCEDGPDGMRSNEVSLPSQCSEMGLGFTRNLSRIVGRGSERWAASSPRTWSIKLG